MKNEKRLVYVEDVIALFEKDIAESKDALKTAFYGDKEEIRAEMNGVRAALCILKHHASHGGTVDAVEWDDMRAFAEDVACQFCYYCQNGGRLHITHGGLSTLEWAFDILEWENPHPVPEFECEIEGCHEHATCGTPTKDGYKRMCSTHYRERKDNG
jgi:hypothetical protein